MRSTFVDLGAQPIRNRTPGPLATTLTRTLTQGPGALVTKTIVTEGVGTGAITFARFSRAVGDTVSTYRVALSGELGLVGLDASVPVITVLARVRANRVWTIPGPRISTSSAVTVAVLPNPPALIANTWTWLRWTVALTPAMMANLRSDTSLYLPLGGIADDGLVFDLAEVMCVEGAYTGEYFDGASPRANWTGVGNGSASVAYPPSRNVAPDSVNMSGWSMPQILATDPIAVPGCPFPYFINLHLYDTRFSNTPTWPLSAPGYQEWVVEGWAAAPATLLTQTMGGGIRYGDSYANNATNGTFNNGAPTLAPADYRTWQPFRIVYKGAIPDGCVNRVTPNMGGKDAAGYAWQVAGVTFRRNSGY